MRTAVVTGGASGIGAATVARLTRAGYGVWSLDRSGSGEQARHLRCDVGSDTDVAQAAARLAAETDRLDVLVNNAGVGILGPFDATPLSRWREVLDVNVLGTVRMTQALLPLLRRGDAPAVVMTCSALARVGLADRSLYSASKGALASLTSALAAELLDDGIRVNCVLPGVVDTPWTPVRHGGAPAGTRTDLRVVQPQRRLVEAGEVAYAIEYLCSPASISTTGVQLPVDAGMLGVRDLQGSPR